MLFVSKNLDFFVSILGWKAESIKTKILREILKCYY